jgi:hypothetical protein
MVKVLWGWVIGDRDGEPGSVCCDGKQCLVLECGAEAGVRQRERCYDERRRTKQRKEMCCHGCSDITPEGRKELRW